MWSCIGVKYFLMLSVHENNFMTEINLVSMVAVLSSTVKWQQTYRPKHCNKIPVCCRKWIHGDDDYVQHGSKDDDIVEIRACQLHNSEEQMQT